MVSTATALNHDECVAASPQIQQRAPPVRAARQAPAVDAEDAIARLDADAGGPTAGPDARDAEAPVFFGLEPHAEKSLAQRPNLKAP
jgi:hypothetical protein